LTPQNALYRFNMARAYLDDALLARSAKNNQDEIHPTYDLLNPVLLERGLSELHAMYAKPVN